MERFEATRKTHLLAALALAFLAASLLSGSRVLLSLSILCAVAVAAGRVLRPRPMGPARRMLPTPFVQEEEALPVTLELRGPRLGSAWVEVREQVPSSARLERGSNYVSLVLGRNEKALVQYEVATPRLGTFRLGPADLRQEDVLGLTTSTRRVAEPTEYLVRPRPETLKRSPERSEWPHPLLGRHEVSQPGEGFDFFGLRDYMPGDRMRSINWKASARSHTLIVNQFERESRAEIVLFLDARALAESGVETHTPYVMSARAAAALVQRYVRGRDRVRIIVYGAEVSEMGADGVPLRFEEILDRLARIEAQGDTPLLRAVDELLPSLHSRSPVVVLSPLSSDPTVEDAVTALRSHDLHVTVVVPRYRIPPGANGAWSARVLEQSLAAEGLRSLGALVIELDPETPLSPQLQGVAA